MNAATAPTIHVVDDDAEFRASLAFLLDVVGYRTHGYADAAAFLAASPGGPGCVIVDLAMPGLTGLELQQQMHARGIELPLVFLSAHGDVRSGVQAMRAGAEDFLTKPVDGDELLDAVGRALARDGAQRERRAADDELRARALRLSARETEVLRHVIGGRMNKQIAADLGLALQTVKFHRGRVMTKLDARSVADLALVARAAGLEPLPEPVTRP
jgi:FixJ family two-component response regulator